MKNKTVFLILSLFLLSFNSFGQNREKLTRSITFEDNSVPDEIIIPIGKDVLRFELSISTTVIYGKLILEVYDPNGIKQGNFIGEAQLDSKKSERITGHISKYLKEPQPGNWTVKIIPTKATASIQINTNMLK